MKTHLNGIFWYFQINLELPQKTYFALKIFPSNADFLKIYFMVT